MQREGDRDVRELAIELVVKTGLTNVCEVSG